MTGFEIYTNASATMFIDTGKNVKDEQFTVRFLNILMQETLPYENNLREFKGLEKLTGAPVITTLDESIPYQDEITRLAMPYGLASLYQQEELDAYQASVYRQQYLVALNDLKKGIWEELE